jgi:hypothetical protein
MMWDRSENKLERTARNSKLPTMLDLVYLAAMHFFVSGWTDRTELLYAW